MPLCRDCGGRGFVLNAERPEPCGCGSNGVPFLVLHDGAAVAVVEASDDIEACMIAERDAAGIRDYSPEALAAFPLAPVPEGECQTCDGCLCLMSAVDGCESFAVPIGGGASCYCLDCARVLVAR